MKDKAGKRNGLLIAVRAFSLLSLPLLCLPFSAMYLNCLLLLPGIAKIWQYQLLCTAVCLGGLGVSSLFQKLPFAKSRRWMCDFLAILLGIIPLLIGLVAGKEWLCLPSYTWMAAGPFLLFPWILGIRAQGKEYHEVMDRSLFSAYLAESVCAVAIYAFNHVAFPLLTFVGSLLAVTAAYGISRNQGNLDFLMERRGHSFSHLPARIRYYNIRLLAVLLGGILVFFLLCFPLSWLVQQGFSLLRYLLSLIPSSTPTEEEPITYPPPDTSQMEPPLPAGEASPIWNFLSVLIIIGVLVLLVRNSGKIVRTILETLRRWMLALRRLMTREQFKGPQKVESEYYVDEDITLDSTPQAEQMLNEKQQLRKWKQQVRRFRKMPDNAEKLRFGYGLAVAGMKLKNFPLAPGDTPLEILEKTAPVLQNSRLTLTTPLYNLVRYGGSHPENGISLEELQAVLDELEKRAPLPKVSHRLS